MKLTEKQLTVYIQGLVHSCKNRSGTHLIKECKEKKAFTAHFIEEYKKNRWRPKLYDRSIKYED